MNRRRSLIVQVAVLGALVALALPSSGSALSAEFIYLTSSGPSPATLTMSAGMYPVWMNQDTVAHTVTFPSGCSIEVAAGQLAQCPDNGSLVVGDNPYTVDGTVQASITVTPAWRAVTIHAKRHGFRLDSKVLLHGTLAISSPLPPGYRAVRMPVTVLSRAHGRHTWHRLAVVMAKPPTRSAHRSVWHLRVRLRTWTTYRVVANSQPKGGTFWEDAQSGPFGLYVRRH